MLSANLRKTASAIQVANTSQTRIRGGIIASPESCKQIAGSFLNRRCYGVGEGGHHVHHDGHREDINNAQKKKLSEHSHDPSAFFAGRVNRLASTASTSLFC